MFGFLSKMTLLTSFKVHKDLENVGITFVKTGQSVKMGSIKRKYC